MMINKDIRSNKSLNLAKNILLHQYSTTPHGLYNGNEDFLANCCNSIFPAVLLQLTITSVITDLIITTSQAKSLTYAVSKLTRGTFVT